MKEFGQKILRFFAMQILEKYKPRVIGITGSMGKSSSKEAVYAVLSTKFNVRRNIKNYNNEIGVPLTIIGETSGSRSFVKWLKVFWKAFELLIFRDKDYPEILILEMGADRPGDIKYLTDMAPCNVGVLTTIAPVHVEFFKDIQGVINEKKTIITHLKKDGTAVLNRDDINVWNIRDEIEARVMSFGFEEGADVRAVEVKNKFDPDPSRPEEAISGTTFKLVYGGNTVPVTIPSVLGRAHVYAGLVAATIGIHSGINMVEIANALKNYVAPKGRMRIIKGIKHTWLLDDTYNASPLATLAAVNTLDELTIYESGRRWAVLGDMLELGSFTEKGHMDVGRRVAELGIDFLVTVGERAKDIARAAIENGMDEDRIFYFNSSPEAGRFLQDKIRENDLLLVKGSQSMRMERIAKELMAEPLKAGEMLCRQEVAWLKR